MKCSTYSQRTQKMATFRTSYRHNIALEEQIWTLTLEEGRKVINMLKPKSGSYWYNHLAKPYKLAQRMRLKKITFKVHTAGFSTGEFANMLSECNIEYIEENEDERNEA
jgi:hypothetical protein